MDIDEKALRVRMYFGEGDKHGHTALYKAVVHLLRERGVWGATVLRGIYGYGKASAVHAASPLRLSGDLPIVVEVVDRREKLQALLPELCAMVKGGLVTTEEVTVVTHVSPDDAGRR